MSYPCQYIPLSEFTWNGAAYTPWPDCPSPYPWNPVVYTLLASFLACTFCICLEVIGQAFARFRRRKSLYFWSILFASMGSMIFSIGSILGAFTRNTVVSSAILNVGWVLFTPSFSLILYSRLHLLKPNPRILKATLWLIIVSSILFLIPTVVLTTLLSLGRKPLWFKLTFISTKTESAFTLQEALITTTYVVLFIRFTKGRRDESSTKRILALLLSSEMLVIATDIVLLVLLYEEIYLARQMLQAFFGALKIRVEFIVLNSLVDYSQSTERQKQEIGWHGQIEMTPSPVLQNVGGFDLSSEAKAKQDIEAVPSRETVEIQ